MLWLQLDGFLLSRQFVLEQPSNMKRKKATSLQDLIRKRQGSSFVGRTAQLDQFRSNLALDWDDERRTIIFNVWGQGGVGKTTLISRFQQITREHGSVSAVTDEAEHDIPTVMGRWAEQLQQQGHTCKAFADRYRTYRQKRDELETDPDAPSQGLTAFAARTLTKTGVHLARRVPVGGAIFDMVDEDVVATQVSEWAEYVRRRLTDKDEVRLVLEPETVLTPLFLQDLQAIAEDKTVVLICDTYERTHYFLDGWLRNLLEGRHGDLPADMLLVISGRDELDRNRWSPFAGVIGSLPLDPFTEDEARDYLVQRGITKEAVIKVILELSGRLPLLVATLAMESPDDPDRIGDASGTAVERFLKWVEDPQQQQLALDAALPRYLNRDILTLLAPAEKVDELFAWLQTMPFIETRAGGCGLDLSRDCAYPNAAS
jgi:hypothetical protein